MTAHRIWISRGQQLQDEIWADSQRCQEFAARFDWSRIAQQTASVYRAALAQSARPH